MLFENNKRLMQYDQIGSVAIKASMNNFEITSEFDAGWIMD